MALQRFGFVVTGSGLDPAEHRMVMRSPGFTMTAIGVPDPSHGPAAARDLVAGGAQLIELCGGFDPSATARVIEAIDDAVPVGVVAYGPQAIEALQRLFAR